MSLRWEKVKDALDNPSRTARAAIIFEMFEEERKLGVEAFFNYGLDTENKKAVAKYKKAVREKRIGKDGNEIPPKEVKDSKDVKAKKVDWSDED